MPSLLERQLKKLAENDAFAQELFSLWVLDKKKLAEALQSVGRVFSHYSRHDVSHSETILENIVTFLGEENIEYLTPTDIWLLLQSAYWHDIGMLVTHKEKINFFSDPNFLDFVDEITDSNAHELHEIACKMRDNVNSFPIDVSLLDNIDSFEQLIAAYIRSQHGARAKDAILFPEKLNYTANRLSLPKRLFIQLGDICSSHTADFTKVLQTLEWQQNSTPRNVFHPRFIACLLRMGDLLDLDDGRFSPTLEILSGPPPASQKGHKDKHASIEKFHFTNKHISISAFPQTYEGYAETARIFSMLKKEMTDLWLNWDEIVPEDWPGSMPRLGKLEVSMGNGYELITEGYTPELGVDVKAALELFQGANIYEERWSAIRELMQNSVDATLIRIWLTHQNIFRDNTKELSPISDEFKTIAKLYPITVRIAYDDENSPNSFSLEIEDRGIGISKQTFSHMLSVGSSSKAPKAKIIKRMPEWLKPSGAFGLGIQSVFALGAKELRFISSSYEDLTKREYTIPSPSSSLASFPTIKFLHESTQEKCGTIQYVTLELTSEVYLFDTEYSPYSLDSLRKTAYRTELGYFLDEILGFGSHIGIETQIYVNNKPYHKEEKRHETGLTLFDKETNIALRDLRFRFSSLEHGNHTVKLKYRGNKIEHSSLNYPYTYANVDVYRGSAKEALDISRRYFRQSFKRKIDQQILELIQRNSDFIINNLNDEQLVWFSFFVREFSLEVEFPKKIAKLIKSIQVTEKLTFGELIEKRSILLLSESVDGFPIFDASKDLAKKGIDVSEYFVLHCGWYNQLKNSYDFLLKELTKKEYGYHSQIQLAPDGYSSMVLFQRDEILPFSNEWLQSYIDFHFVQRISGIRSKTIPAIDKFPAISINKLNYKSFDERFEWFIWSGAVIDQSSDVFDGENSIILPFVSRYGNETIDTPHLEDICIFLSKNNKTYEYEEIINCYLEFIAWIDSNIMKNNKDWQRRRRLKRTEEMDQHCL